MNETSLFYISVCFISSAWIEIMKYQANGKYVPVHLNATVNELAYVCQC